MSIRRVVPHINSERLDESRALYVGVLGFKVAMDLGWVVTFARSDRPDTEIWLRDEREYFVQKGVGALRTSLGATAYPPWWTW